MSSTLSHGHPLCRLHPKKIVKSVYVCTHTHPWCTVSKGRRFYFPHTQSQSSYRSGPTVTTAPTPSCTLYFSPPEARVKHACLHPEPPHPLIISLKFCIRVSSEATPLLILLGSLLPASLHLLWHFMGFICHLHPTHTRPLLLNCPSLRAGLPLHPLCPPWEVCTALSKHLSFLLPQAELAWRAGGGLAESASPCHVTMTSWCIREWPAPSVVSPSNTLKT